MRAGILRKTLLATVSAAALAFGAVADAQEASPRWWASVQGQYAFMDGTFMKGDDLGGEFFGFYDVDLGPDDGWAGQIRGGGRINGDWFVEGALRYGRSGTDRASVSYYSYFGSEGYETTASYKEDHIMLDLQVGRDVGLGGSRLHVFGGVRFAQFSGEMDMNASFFYSGDGYGYAAETFDLRPKFTGIGPRVGLDAMVPFGANARLDVGLAGAALYGKRRLGIRANILGCYDGDCYSNSIGYSDSDKAWVPNVEASAALTYLFSPNAAVSAGYRVEKFWNVMPDIDLNDEGFGHDDRLIHGPFLQLTFTGD